MQLIFFNSLYSNQALLFIPLPSRYSVQENAKLTGLQDLYISFKWKLRIIYQNSSILSLCFVFPLFYDRSKLRGPVCVMVCFAAMGSNKTLICCIFAFLNGLFHSCHTFIVPTFYCAFHMISLQYVSYFAYLFSHKLFMKNRTKLFLFAIGCQPIENRFRWKWIGQNCSEYSSST